MKRRDFIKNTMVTGAAASMVAPNLLLGRDPLADDKLKIGFIGTGARGLAQLKVALNRSDIEVTALCDIDEEVLQRASQMVIDKGHKRPATYGKNEMDYQNMLDPEKVDGVIISTPWLWHTPMAVDAMEAGVAVGLEVAGATDLEECWQLVNTYEKTGTPFMFLENVCYRRDVMAVLHMVRQELFGELIHLEGGYQHDLRHVKFNNGQQLYGGGVEFGEKGYSEAKWRTNHSVHRNGDLYPTHGLGPVSTYININRGNRFIYLTSTSTKSRGLHDYITEHPKGGEDHPNASVKFELGDIVTSVIKTAKGETITLQHDTNLPRPYSLGFRVQGTRGLWMDVNQSIYIEGKSPSHSWEDAQTYLDNYDHPLWKKHEQKAVGAGHGGMDFFVLNAFIEALKRQEPMPIDVYDAASWMAVTCLSEQSIAQGSQPMPFPDFTRGKWTNRKAIFALDDRY